MIPKKIHYCWFGGNKLPKEVKKCIKSWKKYCPDYEIIQWNESNFDINCNDFVKKAYENKSWAFVSDYARLKIIYEQGGIYLDTDVELLKNLDDLLSHTSFFGVQQADNQVNTGLCFGAEKGANIVNEMLKEYDYIEFDIHNKEQIICPILNTKALFNYGFVFSDEIQNIDNNYLYPPKYFDPIAPGDSKNLMNHKTYSIHHYSATWTKKGNRIKRMIINLIGQERINRVKRIIKR